MLIFRTGGNPSVVKRISDAKFEKAAGASNTLRLVVRGPIAYLLINGTYIDTFDVSKRQSGGAVLVASGILPDDKVAGATVRYEGFTISELK